MGAKATIKLPKLVIAQNNFASAVINAGNRTFALYQIDTARTPFWVVELDACHEYLPMGPAEQFTRHDVALQRLVKKASGWMESHS